LFQEQDREARWRAEVENATARLELARMRKHMAHLISQHEPVASTGLDRGKLKHLLAYVQHGDLKRLERELHHTEA
jgi:hypothetical protein